jgi:hypothetical protein
MFEMANKLLVNFVEPQQIAIKMNEMPKLKSKFKGTS